MPESKAFWINPGMELQQPLSIRIKMKTSLQRLKIGFLPAKLQKTRKILRKRRMKNKKEDGEEDTSEAFSMEELLNIIQEE